MASSMIEIFSKLYNSVISLLNTSASWLAMIAACLAFSLLTVISIIEVSLTESTSMLSLRVFRDSFNSKLVFTCSNTLRDLMISL